MDYASPIWIKSGRVRKPFITNVYVALIVSLSVKAVHLEPITELTTTAFIATLHRFIARQAKPSITWSDHGTNFVGATREIHELVESVKNSNECISDLCTTQGIWWKFNPKHAPHFGGLWEAAVKSMKEHFERIVEDVKLTFEELTTLLVQIEAFLHSRTLTEVPEPEDGIEALTRSHFLIGRPVEALPDPPPSFQSMTMLRRWNLCPTTCASLLPTLV